MVIKRMNSDNMLTLKCHQITMETRTCEQHRSVRVFFFKLVLFQCDARICAALICRLGLEKGVRRSYQQENHFVLCSCTAWLARSQVCAGRVRERKREREGWLTTSPLLLSFSPNPQTLSLSLSVQVPEATGEEEEEDQQKRGQLSRRATSAIKNKLSKDVKLSWFHRRITGGKGE